MGAIRWGLLFGAGIAATNMLLQFVVTPFLPWQVIGLLSVGAWVACVVAAGIFAGRTTSLRLAASAAAIAAAVDLLRNAAVAIAVGVPIPSSAPQGSPTPGLIIVGTMLAFFLIGPIAAGVGMTAARLTRRSPAPQTVTRD